MSGPQIVCVTCGAPTSVAMPICASCGGKPPEPVCVLCESALNPASPIKAADRFGLHYTKGGGYAGPCIATQPE